jgi:raffinose/stachyose/melibiose transport system permease protein
MNPKKMYPVYLVIPAFLIYAVFFIIPNVSGLALAFTDWNIYFFDDIHFNGLDNFIKLFHEEVFWIALKNTFLFAVATVLGKNLLGFLMALLVAKTSKFNIYLRTVMFLPVTISTIVVSIIFVSIYNPDMGIVNQFLRSVGLGGLARQWLVDPKVALWAVAAMEIWQWSGFNMVVFVAGMQSIPDDFFEAARIDGAGRWQTLKCITVPLMVQSFAVTFVFSIISGFKVFAQIYGTTNGGPADATQVMGTFLFKSFSEGKLGYSAAVGVIFMFLILAFSLIFLIILRKKEVEY